MKFQDVMIKYPKSIYQGYELQTVRSFDEEIPATWDVCRKMERIPHKISYFIDRSKIAEVRKTTFNNIDFDYYLVKLVDNTYLELVY